MEMHNHTESLKSEEHGENARQNINAGITNFVGNCTVVMCSVNSARMYLILENRNVSLTLAQFV